MASWHIDAVRVPLNEDCWLGGCTLPDGMAVSGMQQLVDAVRSTGASQPVMVEGLNWGGDMSGFLAHQPVDPDHNLIASVHLYDYSRCDTVACWNQTVAPVAAKVRVVTGELEETDCGHGLIDTYMSWADASDVSYLAWAWDTGGGWSCSNGPGLLDSYSGVPNAYGAGVRAHLGMLAASSPIAVPVPPVTPPGTTTAVTATVDRSWGTGAVVDLHVTDTGPVTLGTSDAPWTPAFSLPSGTEVTDMWNDRRTSEVRCDVSAEAPGYTPTLAPVASMDVGWVEQRSTALPADISVTAPAERATSAVLSSTFQLTDSWGTGANAAVTVANVGPAVSGPWRLTFVVSSGTAVTVMWCASLISERGGTVTAAGPDWARTLAPGQRDTVGWTQDGSTAVASGVAVAG